MTDEITATVIIICAFHKEALPIIEFYKLRKDNQHKSFEVYANEQIILVECGLGNIAAASAVSYIAGYYSQTSFSWLNIGIGGHQDAELGQGYLVNKITDPVNSQQFFPDFSHDLKIPSKSLTSVVEPELRYIDDAIYEMEAVGFFTSAIRFSTLELIQCYKIVSDNRQSPINNLDINEAIQHIQDNLPTITKLIEYLAEQTVQYRTLYSDPIELKHYMSNLHFTQTQKNQLLTLLIRWKARNNKSIEDAFPFGQYHSSKSLLNAIQTQLNHYTI